MICQNQQKFKQQLPIVIISLIFQVLKMDTKIETQIKATEQRSKVQIYQGDKKAEIEEIQYQKRQQPREQLLMKLYVYGSGESDQFRHPDKLYESKKPICMTNIERFDLNDDDDEGSWKQGDKKSNIYINPLFQKSVYKIACGGLHSVVLTTDGKAYTFGCNDQGALGRKGPESIPIQVQLDNPVDLISAGDNHTMFANSANGIVYFTGSYKYLRGQKMVQSVKQPIKFTTASLDVRNRNHAIRKIVSGDNHTCILVNNRIFCRGQPESFTTGRRINERRKAENSLTFEGVGLNNVQDVWCGGYHTVVKVKKGRDFVYHTWGKNDQGQLGIGNFESQAFPVQIKNLRGKNIIRVAAGGFFTLFLTDNGQILCCGTNEYGQLGLGQDYEFIPSQPQSQEQLQIQQKQASKSEQLINKHVQQLNIQQASKNKQNGNQIQNEVRQLADSTGKMQIQSLANNKINVDSQIIRDAVQRSKGEMIPERQQKGVATVVVTQTISPLNMAPQPINLLNANNLYMNSQPVNLSNVNNLSMAPQPVVDNTFGGNQANISPNKKYQQKNTYIKCIRPIVFPQESVPKGLITKISAGGQFAFAWNCITQLYSWGFGMNYVLLTGQQNQEYQPFKVRNKIINDQIIDEIQAGGQHVLYTAFQKTQSKFKPNLALQQKVTAFLGGQKNKLSRKRKN